MQKSFLAIVLASSVTLSACATDSQTAGDMAQGAAIGAAGGADCCTLCNVTSRLAVRRASAQRNGARQHDCQE